MSAWLSSTPPLQLEALYLDRHTKTLYPGPTSFPDPTASRPRAHVVQVCAVALSREDLDRPHNNADRHIPGYEFSGYVVSAPFLSPFKPGAQVYGHTSFGSQGNARPFTVAQFSELAVQPTLLSWEQCAAVPMSALTAFQALFDQDLLKRPERKEHWTPMGKGMLPEPNRKKLTLITGAATPVGMWAVQLANRAGAGHIAATCPARDVSFVRALGGAHEVLNERAEGDLTQWRRSKFHIVLDCAGPADNILQAAWTVVQPYGKIISVVARASDHRPEHGVEPGVATGYSPVGPAPDELELISSLLDQGLLHDRLDKANIFDMADYARALDRLRDPAARGKVVLRVRTDEPRPIIDFLAQHSVADQELAAGEYYDDDDDDDVGSDSDSDFSDSDVEMKDVPSSNGSIPLYSPQQQVPAINMIPPPPRQMATPLLSPTPASVSAAARNGSNTNNNNTDSNNNNNSNAMDYAPTNDTAAAN